MSLFRRIGLVQVHVSAGARLFLPLQVKDAQRIAVIGGGATGTELAVEIAVVYPDKEVTLIHSGEMLISKELTAKFHRKMRAVIDKFGVICKLGR